MATHVFVKGRLCNYGHYVLDSEGQTTQELRGCGKIVSTANVNDDHMQVVIAPIFGVSIGSDGSAQVTHDQSWVAQDFSPTITIDSYEVYPQWSWLQRIANYLVWERSWDPAHNWTPLGRAANWILVNIFGRGFPWGQDPY